FHEKYDIIERADIGGETDRGKSLIGMPVQRDMISCFIAGANIVGDGLDTAAVNPLVHHKHDPHKPILLACPRHYLAKMADSSSNRRWNEWRSARYARVFRIASQYTSGRRRMSWTWPATSSPTASRRAAGPYT